MWKVYLSMLADSESAYNEFWKNREIQEHVHNGILIKETEMYCKDNHIWQSLTFTVWNAGNMRNLFSKICGYNNKQSRHTNII